ncbi:MULTISPECIES: DUF6204 family protein [Streptomyces]|uniref:DUF6204 family protein n=1 Tax=Streptomyces lienomycini TaxID=284035 RepID=A0ABV9WMD6_9ACTN|nr:MULTISPECIES: DUF6204 family protein [Streptomyces]
MSERHVGEQHASGQHTYRVIVRGTWEGLTEGARARLLGEAGEHGMASMRFTEDGSLSYEPSPLKHFSMRYVVVSDAADGEEMAGAIAEDRAERALRALGYGFRDLRSTVTDLDTMKINRRSRTRR